MMKLANKKDTITPVDTRKKRKSVYAPIDCFRVREVRNRKYSIDINLSNNIFKNG